MNRRALLVGGAAGWWILGCSGLAFPEPAPIPAEHRAWIGIWVATTEVRDRVEITADGWVYRLWWDGPRRRSYLGAVQEWRTDGFVAAGRSGVVTEFVAGPPVEVDGRFEIVFDGKVFVRQ